MLGANAGMSVASVVLVALACGVTSAFGGEDERATRAFRMPASSMMPTLLVGDYLMADMTAYDDGGPQRGDLVVLLKPDDNKTVYLKRVVGLPGDSVQMVDGVLNINGEPVRRVRIDNYVGPAPRGGTIDVPRYRETLPGGVTYETLDINPDSFLDNTAPHAVQAGHYYLLGDNRDNSADSRVLLLSGGLGDIPRENIIGQASYIYWSRDLSRIGTSLR